MLPAATGETHSQENHYEEVLFFPRSIGCDQVCAPSNIICQWQNPFSSAILSGFLDVISHFVWSLGCDQVSS
jgi:hypothetical protein